MWNILGAEEMSLAKALLHVIGINFYINPVRAAFLERSFDFSCERYT
jgi:hypothetical protein